LIGEALRWPKRSAYISNVVTITGHFISIGVFIAEDYNVDLMSDDFGARIILRGKNHSVFELFQDSVLQVLHPSSRDIEHEEFFGGVDRMSEVIPFTNTEHLHIVRAFRIPILSQPCFS